MEKSTNNLETEEVSGGCGMMSAGVVDDHLSDSDSPDVLAIFR